jgi:hypothetical protein
LTSHSGLACEGHQRSVCLYLELTSCSLPNVYLDTGLARCM